MERSPLFELNSNLMIYGGGSTGQALILMSIIFVEANGIDHGKYVTQTQS